MLRLFATLLGITLILALLGAGGVIYGLWHFGKGLPDYRQLADYEPPVMTRVHAGDGRLVAEYAIEKRVFVPINGIPKRIIRAFLSAEDKNFYSHPGVDATGLLRAVVVNIKNLGSDRRPVGASTITQQVAKNFLLTNEVSIERKAKEAILAFRIERAFTKERILELYLNEIYLGFGSYGVAAAALNYFDKSMDQLSIAEAAYLAALPKAPNNYHPFKKTAAAIGRRDWVIGRMLDDGWITEEQAAEAKAEPLKVVTRADTEFVTADYFAEEVRRELAERYGEDALYQGGLSVRTTLDPMLQRIADMALKQGLEAYDRRHGYRGPIAKVSEGTDLSLGGNWQRQLLDVAKPGGLGDRMLAVVLGLDGEGANIGFEDGKTGRIPMSEMKWAREWQEGQKRGPAVSRPDQVLKLGDVVAVEPLTRPADEGEDDAGKVLTVGGQYRLWQVPDVEGAVVALDPHTGRVLAMSGGYDHGRSVFNRAVQAKRQPGSAFKPFVYLAGLDSGFTPATLVLDAPFVIDQGPGQPKWRPANYTNKFYGPSTMRLGIEKSRNLMTVRLAQTVGMEKISEYAARFGITQDMPPTLAMSLGAGETTLLDLTAAYAMLVNGGKKIEPSLIDRIQDRNGKTVWKHDQRPCPDCNQPHWTGQPVPQIPDDRPLVTSPQSAYQMVSMLQGVVERGTGRRIRAVGKPLAGKTGTTNDSQDAWFIGFSPDLAFGVFAGFDTPKPLGKQPSGYEEQGSSVAAPVFLDFMQGALKDQPAIPFRIPEGIRLVRVDAGTGVPTRSGGGNAILEAFKPGTVPQGRSEVLRGIGGETDEAPPGPALSTGTGGLY